MLDEDFSGWYRGDTARTEPEPDYSEAWWSSPEPEPKAKPKTRRPWRWLGALLGVVLLIIASASLFHNNDKPTKPDTSIPAQ